MIAYKVSLTDFVPADVAIVQFEKNRETLKTAKQKIQDCVDHTDLKTWNITTEWYEMSKSLIMKCRNQHGIPKNASNAFFKAIELFQHFAPVDNLRLFDNASLPGDFIRAAQWMRGVDWRANSIIGGLCDKYNLIRDNPTNWMMNSGMNGDVTSTANIASIDAQLGAWRPNMYTSDLGFGVKDYNAEETEHFAAHQGQVMLGLRILEECGTFIVKTFTMFDADTHALLNYTMQHFDTFYIVKPRTSKQDNSECYWVGIGFHKLTLPLVANAVYPRSVVNIATALTLRQSKKIILNAAAYNSHKTMDWSTEVAEWCANIRDKARNTHLSR